MMTRIYGLAIMASLTAAPALAASGPFVSLRNTNFIVLLAFIVFLLIVFYFKAPTIIGKMLDDRAETIKKELDEARALREEAQTLLASYERKQREVAQHAEAIVAAAREEAEIAAKDAKVELKASVERRLAAAEDKIASAEAAALRSVRDRAVSLAIGAAGDVLAKQMTDEAADKQMDDAIKVVQSRLH